MRVAALFQVALLLGAQESNQTIRDWIRQLGDDSPDIREVAFAKLLTTGVNAWPALMEHVEDVDPERKHRVRQLLDTPVFLAHPLAIKNNVAMLGKQPPELEQVLSRILVAGDKARQELRELVKEGKGAQSFRAAQLIDVLSEKPVNGLKIGILADTPTHSAEEAIPGYEIFMNTTASSFKLTPESLEVMPHGSGDPVKLVNQDRVEEEAITLKAGQVLVRRRNDLLSRRVGNETLQYRLRKPGEYRLSCDFVSRDARYKLWRCLSLETREGFWKGRVISNTIEIRIP